MDRRPLPGPAPHGRPLRGRRALQGYGCRRHGHVQPAGSGLGTPLPTPAFCNAVKTVLAIARCPWQFGWKLSLLAPGMPFQRYPFESVFGLQTIAFIHDGTFFHVSWSPSSCPSSACSVLMTTALALLALLSFSHFSVACVMSPFSFFSNAMSSRVGHEPRDVGRGR